MKLSGQTILVTGAARRIGRAIALRLADAGADVVVHCFRSRADAEQTATDIRVAGRNAWIVEADLSNATEAEGLVAKAGDVAGCLHGLVNAAAVYPSSTLATLTSGGLLSTMALNAYAPFAATRALAVLSAADGVNRAVVNIADARIVGGDHEHIGYHLSKRTLATITQLAAREYAPRVRVNAVAPGLVLAPDGVDAEAWLRRRVANTPLGAMGTPLDVADAVLYLLTAPFVTGQMLFVDGGRHLHSHL